MTDVFISYAGKDRDWVSVFASALQDVGWTVWWDREIPFGQPFQRVIQEALTSAHCVVVVWSPHSIDSHWVHDEANVAMERGVLLPVAIGEVEPPLGFRSFQTANFSSWEEDRDAAVFHKLKADIARLLPKQPLHAPPSLDREEEASAHASSSVLTPSEPRTPDDQGRANSHTPESRRAYLRGGRLAVVIVLVLVLPAVGLWQLMLPSPLEPLRVGKDGKEMVLIPGGWFAMGLSETSEQNKTPDKQYDVYAMPKHSVWLDAFYMDRHEITRSEYGQFLGEMGNREPFDWAKQLIASERNPVFGVTWEDAQAYCRWANKQLPSEAQWERAARGVEGHTYPWGNDPVDSTRADYCGDDCERNATDQFGGGGPVPVGSHPRGQTPLGIYNLAGNVAEWVYDWLDRDYYSKSPERNPVNDTAKEYRVVRGGGWHSTAWYLKGSSRDWAEPNRANQPVGIRCVQMAEIGS